MATKEEMKNFSNLIEQLAKDLQCSHIEAIVEHCNKTGFEIEVASTLISPRLKSVIRDEAIRSNMLKKEGARLPI